MTAADQARKVVQAVSRDVDGTPVLVGSRGRSGGDCGGGVINSALLENLDGIGLWLQQQAAVATEITALLTSAEMLLNRDVRADFEAYRRAHPTVDPVALARAFEEFVMEHERVPV